MFKEYVRQDEYIITAIIFVRKLLDTNSYCSNQRAARKEGQLFHFQKPFYAAC